MNVGDTVKVFDASAWQPTGDIGDNSIFWRDATILRMYYFGRKPFRDFLADVRFHHDERVSRGHFVYGIERHGQNSRNNL